jgi:hypothetical protein
MDFNRGGINCSVYFTQEAHTSGKTSVSIKGKHNNYPGAMTIIVCIQTKMSPIGDIIRKVCVKGKLFH